MGNVFFEFKKFTIFQPNAGMKVTTEACLFGAWVASKIAPNNKNKICIDIGTGTGLLTCMLAQQHPTLNYIALDNNQAAIQDALVNFKALNFKNTIELLPLALQNFVPKNKFDYIICNPPFFSNSLKGINNNKNNALHNDNLLLDTLLHFLKNNLTINGEAYLLYPSNKLTEIIKITNILSIQINTIIYLHQTQKHEAFRVMLQLTKTKNCQIENKIIIKDNEHYTSAFISLLKPYYLQL